MYIFISRKCNHVPWHSLSTGGSFTETHRAGYETIAKHGLSFGFKILEVKDNKYIKLAYQLMLNDMETKTNCKTWASRVKTFWSTLGICEMWVNQWLEIKT